MASGAKRAERLISERQNRYQDGDAADADARPVLQRKNNRVVLQGATLSLHPNTTDPEEQQPASVQMTCGWAYC